VAQLSLDDFYLSKTDRLDLAKNVHPLLSSRGVPGTHNTQLMGETLNRLQQLEMGENLVLPSFDKSKDDLSEQAFLPEVEGPIDLIIPEGWFVGLTPESESALQAPINDLEANEDPDCSWRIYVNQKLATEYQELFQHISLLVTLQAPDFKQIIHWRTLQEDKLKARSAENTDGIMDLLELKRFVQHFERLTRHGLATMPSTADITYQLDSNHRIIAGSIDPS
jgi:D-glycerate 3-kinase